MFNVCLGRIEYDFQKSRVTGFWDNKLSVSAIKVLQNKFHACVPLIELPLQEMRNSLTQQCLLIPLPIIDAAKVKVGVA
jgi:hypothetical protein